MSDRAQVVYERAEDFDMQHGPWGYEKVGFRIEDRVWWVGCADSMSMRGRYQDDVRLATEIVDAINSKAIGVQK